MQEELYKLDYEDIVAGMPTRFKYREVESNDYGLTTQEILFARDTTLKQFVSLKKMAPYNENDEFNAGSKKRRKFREMLKKDLEDAAPAEEETHTEDAAEPTPADSEPKKKRRRFKKGKKQSKEMSISSGVESDPNSDSKSVQEKDNLQEEGGQAIDSKKRRRKKSGKKGASIHAKSTPTQSEKAAESNKSKSEPKTTRTKQSDDKRKKKKKKKDKQSSITGISHSRLASYGL